MTVLYLYEHGTKVNFKENRLVIDDDITLPVESIEGMVLFGNIQLTGRVITLLLEKEIPVIWLSKTGRFFGRLEQTSNVNIKRQRLQFKHSEDSMYCLEISKQIVEAKINNQKVVLSRYNRTDGVAEVEEAIKRLDKGLSMVWKASDMNTLRGYEGNAAKIYFDAISHLVNDDFKFKGRSKRPPKDRFNSLLSFGYTLLLYDLYTAILSKGLNPYAGFYHEDREKHPTLASDLMEEWRPVIVDSLILNLVRRNMLDPEEFEKDESTGGIYIGKSNIKIFIKEYEMKLLTHSKYLEYLDYDLSYRSAFIEQANLFSKAIEAGNPMVYKPVKIR